ncbi:transcriptional regulator, MucR family [Solidesulfovibrio carbinoliphilus subsp. oakridgensis]|uniref:Transcriptional regulator, MucR family n=1 Tax=Solidesulfovibrio carbinoliphilus subsp. oakridgensis TaxID=694327 RepID=G7QAJ4_9BACT|nr:MucR family transcriptional regulator [Solidesulfovibrio carbinoliphilus]EHJ48747.1 transcriptional regulator, MucR family [Solidesulfovibrio carbinoliphilus subsp. oakridgensis]
MDTYLSLALDIVKAQAKTRNMTEEEITGMVSKLATSIRTIDSGAPAAPGGEGPAGSLDAKKAVKERSITCMESGKAFKILTRRHLAKFGLTPEQYREKWSYPKGMPLVCKSLQRERRKKMREMKLWERRGKA